MGNEEDEVPAQYRIDDLARRTGTTVRSLRVLHDKGLLPSPELRGRTGYYDDQHLARVRLVLRLQERGFTLNAIGELIQAWENGRTLADVLGLEDAQSRPSGDEVPERTTQADLEKRLGSGLASSHVQRMIEAGILEPDGEEVYLVPSPPLINAGIEMVKSGIPLDGVLDISDTLRTDMRATAGRLTDSVATFLVADSPPTLSRNAMLELIGTIDRLRAQARESVSAWFALMMDQAVADYVSSMSSWAKDDEVPSDA
jgi:DNA-binding transcriptional MerR regulator